jgi:hypothetical protein
MTIFGLWVRVIRHTQLLLLAQTLCSSTQVINKAGGLVYQRNFAGVQAR